MNDDKREENKKILANLKKEYELRDKEILKTRDKKYIPVKIAVRTQTTNHGQLIFKRRIYKYYSDTSNEWYLIALLDQELGIKNATKIDWATKQKILDELGTSKSYQEVADKFENIGISLMTISRIYQEANFKLLKNEKSEKIKLELNQNLYLFIDATYPTVRKKCKRMKDGKIVKIWTKTKLTVKVFSFSTGFDEKKSTEKRHVLKNKRYFVLLGKEKKKVAQLAQEIIDQGNKFFAGFVDAHLIIGGDGALWIRNVADYLGVDFVLDKYHAFKYLKKMFGISAHRPKANPETYYWYKKCTKYFEKGDFEKLIKILKLHNASDEILNYFLNNKQGIINFGQEWNIGVSAESDISRVVKSLFAYGSKIYSLKVLRNKIYARINKFNQK